MLVPSRSPLRLLDVKHLGSGGYGGSLTRCRSPVRSWPAVPHLPGSLVTVERSARPHRLSVSVGQQRSAWCAWDSCPRARLSAQGVTSHGHGHIVTGTTLQYTWPGSSWRPSACEADVIATRPQVLMTIPSVSNICRCRLSVPTPRCGDFDFRGHEMSSTCGLVAMTSA